MQERWDGRQAWQGRIWLTRGCWGKPYIAILSYPMRPGFPLPFVIALSSMLVLSAGHGVHVALTRTLHI